MNSKLPLYLPSVVRSNKYTFSQKQEDLHQYWFNICCKCDDNYFSSQIDFNIRMFFLCSKTLPCKAKFKVIAPSEKAENKLTQAENKLTNAENKNVEGKNGCVWDYRAINALLNFLRLNKFWFGYEL